MLFVCFGESCCAPLEYIRGCRKLEWPGQAKGEEQSLNPLDKEHVLKSDWETIVAYH